jgi:hypothetical protein
MVKGTLGSDDVFGVPATTSCARARKAPNDGARDVLDCGDGTDTVYLTPGWDMAHDDCDDTEPSTGNVTHIPKKDAGLLYIFSG